LPEGTRQLLELLHGAATQLMTGLPTGRCLGCDARPLHPFTPLQAPSPLGSGIPRVCHMLGVAAWRSHAAHNGGTHR
jgi:hypothetical protein